LDAAFLVQIRGSDGLLLYAYEAPLSAFYPSGDPISSQPPEELPEQARRLVTSNLPTSPLSTSAELPSYQQGHFEVDNMSDGKVLVDEARYSRLRSARLPVFDHSTAHEAGRYVVYDPETKAAVAVLQWWL
jgi:hypothetical protein